MSVSAEITTSAASAPPQDAAVLLPSGGDAQESAEEALEQDQPQKEYDLYSWRAYSPDSKIIYARDFRTCDYALSLLRGNVLGFDLEWKPTYVKGAPRNPVALVQLADANAIVLIQVSAMRAFPERLKNVLQSPYIVKAGMAIQDDCRNLWADYKVNCRNVVDLSLLARTVDNAHWKGSYKSNIGLARLCETYFDCTLNKGRVQRSNWTLRLSEEQIEYAANDAHAGYMLYCRLSQLLPSVTPYPERAYYTFDFLHGYPYEPCTRVEEPHTALWHPHNPNYDPGPPPEPSKEKQKKVEVLATLALLPLAMASPPRRGRASPKDGAKPPKRAMNKIPREAPGPDPPRIVLN